jgi:hypothetical protein
MYDVVLEENMIYIIFGECVVAEGAWRPSACLTSRTIL